MTMRATLTAADLEMFAKIGVDASVLTHARVCRVTHDDARALCGIQYRSDHLEGIAFPYCDPATDTVQTWRVRRDHPEVDADGSPIAKYVSPPERRHLYFPPGCAADLADVSVPAILVEAEKSALAVRQANGAVRRGGVLPIALGGCWGWRGIAMVTLVIGNSVARAFGLVGALSIVRFRTVVEDTRDTAFVIFAVVVGMGVGAGYALVTMIGIPIVAVACLLLRLWGRDGASTIVNEFSLAMRVSIGRDPDAVTRELFAKHLSAVRLNSTNTARQGAALDLNYHVRLRREEDAVAFVSALNQIEGVQNVELHRL